jgi:hypothetical protein
MMKTYLSWIQSHSHGAILRHLLNMRTTFSWSDTKTSFKYGKLVLMFFHQLF